jgi:hypothetical protein
MNPLRNSSIYNPSGIKLELDYIADTIFHSAPNSYSTFTIRIYGGGSSNIQTLQLIAAIRELNIDRSLYTIEILNCDDVNVNHYSIQDIVKWLLASTVHFITDHVHHGLQLELLDSNYSKQKGHGFTMNSILSELQRLKLHRGFPHGNYLQCPMFLQDKYVYLDILRNQGMCNPTLKVDSRSSWFDDTEGNSTILLSTIDDFLDNCNEEGSSGWVVKLPFVTNQIVKGLKTNLK